MQVALENVRVTDVQELLTASEVAERLRISVATVNRYAREGVLPSVQIRERGKRRFRTDDVDKLVGSPAAKAS